MTLPSVSHYEVLLRLRYKSALPEEWLEENSIYVIIFAWLIDAGYIIAPDSGASLTSKGDCLVEAIINLPEPAQIWSMPDGT